MPRVTRFLAIATLAALAVSCATRGRVQAIEVRTDDVDRFFAVYEAAGSSDR